MRDPEPLVRLIATLLFGLSVLALLFFLSAQMAAHHFQGSAERTIRQVFSEETRTEGGVRHEAVCRRPEIGRQRLSECDPIVVKAERSLRSASCRGRGFLRLLGRHWSCVATFTDGATLRVDVSLGFRRHHLELVLPVRKPNA